MYFIIEELTFVSKIIIARVTEDPLSIAFAIDKESLVKRAFFVDNFA
jgi:hypothetical protein